MYLQRRRRRDPLLHWRTPGAATLGACPARYWGAVELPQRHCYMVSHALPAGGRRPSWEKRRSSLPARLAPLSSPALREATVRSARELRCVGWHNERATGRAVRARGLGKVGRAAASLSCAAALRCTAVHDFFDLCMGMHSVLRRADRFGARARRCFGRLGGARCVGGGTACFAVVRLGTRGRSRVAKREHASPGANSGATGSRMTLSTGCAGGRTDCCERPALGRKRARAERNEESERTCGEKNPLVRRERGSKGNVGADDSETSDPVREGERLRLLLLLLGPLEALAGKEGLGVRLARAASSSPLPLSSNDKPSADGERSVGKDHAHARHQRTRLV